MARSSSPQATILQNLRCKKQKIERLTDAYSFTVTGNIPWGVPNYPEYTLGICKRETFSKLHVIGLVRDKLTPILWY